jgi:hypothetical protein
LLIEWNKFIFEELIPSIWSRVVPALLELDKNINPWSLWPTPSTMISDVYWDSLPSRLFSKSLQAGNAVWPLEFMPTEQMSVYTSATLPSHRLSSLVDAFIAPGDVESTHILAIVAAEIDIVRPPSHIFDFLALDVFGHLVKKLTPPALRGCIEVSPRSIAAISTSLILDD